MIKNIIKKLILKIKLNTLKKSAIIGDNFVFNRKSRIISENKNDIKINKNVMMFGSLVSSNSGKITIGEFSNIRTGCKLFCANQIDIANNVIFSDNVIVSDTNHHPIKPDERLKMISSGWSSELWSWKYAASSPVKIEDNVWLGQYSRILKGVTIGKNSIVASNSVVTKDVPPNSIVAGNPAVVVKTNIHIS